MSPEECQAAYESAVLIAERGKGILEVVLRDPTEDALFRRLVREAGRLGMDFDQGIEYAIERRRSMLN